jgi:hypothetical protein
VELVKDSFLVPRAGKRSCTHPTTAWIVNRISQLSVDFRIVNPDTSMLRKWSSMMRLMIASTAERRMHIRRALKSAEIPLLRWSVGEMLDLSAIAAVVEKVTQAA